MNQSNNPEPVPDLAHLLRERREFLLSIYQLALRTDHLLCRFTREEVKRSANSILTIITGLVKERVEAHGRVLTEDQREIVDNVVEAINSPEALSAILPVIKEEADLATSEYKRARDAKPRNQERDREIVRLREDEEKQFKEIPRLLRDKNPRWVSKDGELLNSKAVARAYGRQKERGGDK